MDIWEMNLKESLIVEKLADKEGKEWEITIIKAGFSKNIDGVTGFPRYYPPETVKDMAKLFEGCPVFAYEFSEGKGQSYDHLPERIRFALPDGLAGNVVGWIDSVQFKSSDGLGKLVGRFHVVANWLREKLLNAFKEGKADLLGFSVDIQAETTNGEVEGQMSNKVTKTHKVNELTVVTNPAAGGQIERLVASMNTKGDKMELTIKDLYSLIFTEGNESIEPLKVLKEDEQTDEKLVEFLKSWQYGKPEEGQKYEQGDKLMENLQGLVEEIIKQINAKAYDKALQLLNTLKASYGYPGKAGYPYPAPKQASVKQSPPPPAAPAKKEGDPSDVSKKVEELQTRLELMTAKDILNRVLASSDLPDPIKNKLRTTFEGKIFEENTLHEAIKLEKEVLTQITESGQIQGLGDQNRIEMGNDPKDKMQKGLDLLVDPSIDDSEKKDYDGISAFRSIREAYTRMTGDLDVRGIIESKRLTEATTADFPYALGTSMYRKLLKEYKKWPQLWRNLCNVVPLDNFKTQDLVRWGGFTTLETVAEDGAYPDMVTPYEERAQYAPIKKGGLFKVTREMIKNDDLRMIRRMPAKMGQAASKVLNQFVFDLLLNYASATINGGTIYDGKALYHVDHFNLGTTAMSYDSIQAAITAMRRQWEFGVKGAISDTGGISDVDVTCGVVDGTKYKIGDLVLMEAEIVKVTNIVSNDLTIVRAQEGTTAAAHADATVIYSLVDKAGIMPKYLWFPPELRSTAEILINSAEKPDTANRAGNPLYKALELMESDRLRGDTNNWFISADPNIYDVIEIGFIDGREEPEILVQDQATVGYVFTNDRITYKVRHEYGGVQTDFRTMYGAIVA